MEVGIEALGVAVPTTYVELGELALARGVPAGKYLDGLGTTRMAVPLPDEDTVTLAARAAQAALRSAGTNPDDIGMLVVGTETAVDHSKPVASYVQGLLDVGPRCRVFETQHACYGGTAALQLALDGDPDGDASFDRLVGPSLVVPNQVVNVDTASLYLALASLLDRSPAPLDGAAIGQFSCGSGCCAEFFTGSVTPGAQARVAALGLQTRLDARRALSIPDDEDVMREREHLDERPWQEPADAGFRYLGVHGHQRRHAAAGG